MISSYYYRGDPDEPWEFEETNLGRMNLLVGASGCGKTRFLNTLFNYGISVVKGARFAKGTWRLSVLTDDFEYGWEYEGVGDLTRVSDGRQNTNGRDLQINREIIKRRKRDAKADYEEIVNRHPHEFVFWKKIT
jgi:predicted GTPase